MNTFDLTAKRHGSSVLTNWLAQREGAAQRAGVSVRNTTVVTSSDLDGMRSIFLPSTSSSGQPVTDFTAMQVSTVWACLAKLGGAVAQIPLNEYREESGIPVKIEKTSLWWLLNESPHNMWTAASWMEWVVRCVHLRGDQHTAIIRSKKRSDAGAIIGFEPFHPDRSMARRVGSRLVYDTYSLDSDRMVTYDQDDMLHFAGFGFNGVHSLSAIQFAARNAIGNSLAAAQYTGRSMGEGAMPQIVLTFPNKVNTDQAKLLRDSFVETYAGLGSRKVPLVISEGGKAEPLQISPADMEMLASRRFEREDICQALGVPPVLIGDNDKTSSWGTGIEQITLGFVKYTLKPHLIRWSQECNRKIFRKSGPFLAHDLEALLAGDSKALAEVARASIGGPGTGDGWKSVNEVRRAQNLPPKEGGDQIYRAPRDQSKKDSKP